MHYDKAHRRCAYVGRVIVDEENKKMAIKRFGEIASGFGEQDSEDCYYLSPGIYGGESGYKTRKEAENATIDETKPDFN